MNLREKIIKAIMGCAATDHVNVSSARVVAGNIIDEIFGSEMHDFLSQYMERYVIDGDGEATAIIALMKSDLERK